MTPSAKRSDDAMTGPPDNRSLRQTWRAAARPLYQLLLKPSVRQSTPFRVLQQLLQDTPQEDVLKKAMAYTASCRLGGDYLEFGVYTGASFSTAFHLAKAGRLDQMRFFAFDSFEGMPFSSEGGGSVHHDPGEYFCDRPHFESILRANGIDETRVEIVEGWYDDVLNDQLKEKLQIDRAAVISADCGLYGSTRLVLDFVTDYVQDGTVVIFGDWFSFRGSPQRGQQRAFAEWLRAHPSVTASLFHRFGWHGNSFILHLG